MPLSPTIGVDMFPAGIENAEPTTTGSAPAPEPEIAAVCMLALYPVLTGSPIVLAISSRLLPFISST